LDVKHGRALDANEDWDFDMIGCRAWSGFGCDFIESANENWAL